MSNPTFRSGPLTYPVAEAIEPYRFVKIDDGALKLAGAADTAIGVASEKGIPTDQVDAANIYPLFIAVHIGGVVPVETEDEFKVGEPVYVAADGKAAKSGTVYAGWAAEDSTGGRVNTVIQLTAKPA